MLLDSNTLPLKVCTKCGQEKPRAEFSRNCRAPDGLQYQCKVCQASWYTDNRARVLSHQATWYTENYDKAMAQRAAYRAANREKEASRNAAWRAANPAYQSAYYIENRERLLVQMDAYRAEHPDRFTAYARNREARKRGNGGSHTAADIRDIYNTQDGLCFWCDCELGGDWHVDHLEPLSRGGSNGPENLAIACPTCNLRKHTTAPMVFLERITSWIC